MMKKPKEKKTKTFSLQNVKVRKIEKPKTQEIRGGNNGGQGADHWPVG